MKARARSSVDQSICLLSRGSQVRILPGSPFLSRKNFLREPAPLRHAGRHYQSGFYWVDLPAAVEVPDKEAPRSAMPGKVTGSFPRGFSSPNKTLTALSSELDTSEKVHR
jgi:hypothetical protein